MDEVTEGACSLVLGQPFSSWKSTPSPSQLISSSSGPCDPSLQALAARLGAGLSTHSVLTLPFLRDPPEVRSRLQGWPHLVPSDLPGLQGRPVRWLRDEAPARGAAAKVPQVEWIPSRPKGSARSRENVEPSGLPASTQGETWGKARPFSGSQTHERAARPSRPSM